MNWLDQLKHARRVSVPLVAINSPDPAATMRAVTKYINGESPVVSWDVCRGVRPVNELGRPVADLTGPGDQDTTIGQPNLFLTSAQTYPAKTIVFLHSADLFFDDPLFKQGIWNLRDQFKQDRRMLILLGSDIQPPASLKDDIVVLDEPLPVEESLKQIILDCDNSRTSGAFEDVEPLEESIISKAIEAVKGLSSYAAEQAIAMAMRKNKPGIDIDHLWESKRKQIELTKGLSVWRGEESFEDVKGLPFIKEFLGKVIRGKNPPNAVIWIDEIEKMVAGSSGSSSDTSGVSQGILGAMLTAMQDQRARGVILLGPPGAGKSLVAKALGREAGVPTVAWDSNAMKGSLVGSSEAAVRTALKVIGSISSNNAVWIATCNSIQGIPTALRRRFSFGTYYFDLPSDAEREAIWNYYTGKFDLTVRQVNDLPLSGGWTGAEIRTCCELAWNLDCTLKEASRYFVPVSQAAPQELQSLREEANGRYLSANNGDVYQMRKFTGVRELSV